MMLTAPYALTLQVGAPVKVTIATADKYVCWTANIDAAVTATCAAERAVRVDAGVSGCSADFWRWRVNRGNRMFLWTTTSHGYLSFIECTGASANVGAAKSITLTLGGLVVMDGSGTATLDAGDHINIFGLTAGYHVCWKAAGSDTARTCAVAGVAIDAGTDGCSANIPTWGDALQLTWTTTANKFINFIQCDSDGVVRTGGIDKLLTITSGTTLTLGTTVLDTYASGATPTSLALTLGITNALVKGETIQCQYTTQVWARNGVVRVHISGTNQAGTVSVTDGDTGTKHPGRLFKITATTAIATGTTILTFNPIGQLIPFHANGPTGEVGIKCFSTKDSTPLTVRKSYTIVGGPSLSQGTCKDETPTNNDKCAKEKNLHIMLGFMIVFILISIGLLVGLGFALGWFGWRNRARIRAALSRGAAVAPAVAPAGEFLATPQRARTRREYGVGIPAI